MTSIDQTKARALLEELKQGLGCCDRAGVNTIVGNLLGIAPWLGGNWRAIATVMQQHGEVDLAIRAMDAFVRDMAGDPAASFAKAVLLGQLGRQAEARDLMRAIPATVPSVADHAFAAGSLALHLGVREDARDMLLTATAARPSAGEAWLALAACGSMREDEAGDRLIAAERAVATASPLEQGAFWYAVGKVHADRLESSRAFAAFARGAEIMARLQPYDAASDRRSAETSLAFAPHHLQDQGDNGRSPVIFVTGLPRSGTTLVEQILASHSAVAGGDELNLLRLVAEEVGGPSIDAVLRTPSTPARAAALYRHLLHQRFGTHGLVVDKTLNTSRFMGLVACMLPQARIVWMRRDPLDCAWSCFRSFFAAGASWSYRLDAMAAHFRLEDRLLDHWRGLLGDRLMVLDYPDLVGQPTDTIRRLLAFCGLAEEEAVFTPHLAARAVSTTSTLQVREPIHQRGIGVSAPYRHLLAPFTSAYLP